MNRLFHVVLLITLPYLVQCSEASGTEHYNRLVCTFDRTITASIPYGSLFALMGRKEACKCSLAASLQEGLPSLVSLHIVQNLYKHIQTQNIASNKEVRDILLKIAGETKAHASPYSEIKQAEQWVDNPIITKYRYNHSIKDLIQGKLICQTNNPNLQMILIIPCDAKTPQQKIALLKKIGFAPDKFSILGVGCTILKDLLSQAYDTPEKVKLIGDPIDVNALTELFIDDASIRRSIFLVGHGQIGSIAQFNKARFSSLLTAFGKKNCTNLGIFSCYSSAQSNRDAYTASSFPLFLFSVGDTVSHMTSDLENFCLTDYFDGVEKYIQQGSWHNKSNLPLLKQSLAHIHCNVAQNIPWIFFPDRAEFIHESTLDKLNQDQHDARASIAIGSDSQQSIPPMQADEDRISITHELLTKIQPGTPLELVDKKTMFLHVKTIPIFIICMGKIPQMFSMDIFDAHCFEGFEFRDIDNSLKLLLEALQEIKIPTIIKNIHCSIAHELSIENIEPGSPIHLEDVLITPILCDTYNVNIFRIIFKLNRRFYQYQASKSHGYLRQDFPQSGLQEIHSQAFKRYIDDNPDVKSTKRSLTPEENEESRQNTKRSRQ